MKLMFVVILSIICFVVVYSFRSGDQNSKPMMLNVFITGDINGRIEPCGCFNGQHGGMTRIKYILDQDTVGQNRILIDVGDSIKGKEDYHLLQYEYQIKAYQLYGYDALNIGAKEAKLSLSTLKKMKKDHSGLFVSANVFFKEDQSLVFDPYKIIEKGDQKIAIIGLVDPKNIRNELDEGIFVNDIKVSLQNTLKEIKGKADSIIVMAFADKYTMVDLAKEFFEVNLIVGGDVEQPSQEMEYYGSTGLMYTTNDSRAVGWSLAEIVEGKWSFKGFKMEFLSETIPEFEDVQHLMDEYRAKVKNVVLKVDSDILSGENIVTGVKPNSVYAGSESCSKCHQKEYEIWQKSKHAHAFAALKPKGATSDPNCIKCHTVGFQQPGGYMRSYGEEKLINVGCENCHGPASEHVRLHEAGESVLFKLRSVGKDECKKCHFGEFSRPFEFDHFWPIIKH